MTIPSVFLVCKVMGTDPDSSAPILAPADPTDCPIVTEEDAKKVAEANSLKDSQERVILKSFAIGTLQKTVIFNKTNGASVHSLKAVKS